MARYSRVYYACGVVLIHRCDWDHLGTTVNAVFLAERINGVAGATDQGYGNEV